MSREPGFGDELLRAEEVARRLGVQPVTVYRWCRDGRLRCLKPGKSWRIRVADLDAFLRRGERPRTLAQHLGAFLETPDQVLAIVEDESLLGRFDAAFFKVGEARGGLLAKFFDPSAGSRDEATADLRRHGLDVDRLEAEGRFRWCEETDLPGAGVASLGRLLAEEGTVGKEVWAAFDWPNLSNLEAALRQQEGLAALAAQHPLVVATGVVDAEPADWPSLDQQWRLLGTVRGVVRFARAGLLLSRVAPPPVD